MFKRPKSNIYLRLVLTFVLIVAPLYALSLKLNVYGEQAVKKEISSSMLAKVHFYLGLINLDIGKIVKLGRQYFADEDIGTLSVAAEVMTDYEKTRAMIRLQKQLLLLKTSSNYIANASVHIPKLGRTISADDAINPMRQDEFTALSVPSKQSSPFIEWNGRLFISYPYPEYALTDRAPTFLVDIEINRTEIERNLHEMIGTDKGAALLIDDDLQWSITSGGDQAAAPALIKWAMNQIKAGATEKAETVKVDDKPYFVSYEFSSSLGAALLLFLPENSVMGPLNKHRAWYWLLSAVSAVIIIFFSYVIYRLIHRPLRTLVRAFRAVEQGDFHQTVRYRFKDEFSYLYFQFNVMVERLRVLIHEVYEQRYRAQVAEFRQLQSQINPHFLYNSFFTLSRIAKNEDYENVALFTRYLGEYFQFITRDGAGEVPLEAEWSFAKTFVEIQSFRFSSRIDVRYGELPPGCRKLPVPRLTLQPIVENAYNHGLANKRRDGLIEAAFEERDSFLVMSVEDNGDELSDDKLGELLRKLHANQIDVETTGLVNVHRRLQIRFGDNAGLRLSRGSLGGLRVEIVIPLEGKKEHVPLARR